MTGNEAIYVRKSTRKYDMTPLDDKTLDELKAHLAHVKPLYPDIRVEYEFTEAKGASVKAPHYLAVYSENKDNYLANAGFMFQQFCLYLTSIGVGSCWVGIGKSDVAKIGLEHVIIIAFGKPLDSPYRDANGFDRKALEEISNVEDERFEVARLAPSAMNSQPWYFMCEEDQIHVYYTQLGAFSKMRLQKMNQVDMGIMLCHLYIANPDTFATDVRNGSPEVKGYAYLCSVRL